MKKNITITGDFTAAEFTRIVALIRDMDTVPGRLLKVMVTTDNSEPVTFEQARELIQGAMPAREDRDTTPVVQLSLNESLDDRQMHMLRLYACPDCDRQPLIPGPKGGMNQNFACPHCGAEFNMAVHGGVLVWAHRVSPFGNPDLHRLRQIYGISL